jgi:alpha-glucoside transport system substrate-binding protein
LLVEFEGGMTESQPVRLPGARVSRRVLLRAGGLAAATGTLGLTGCSVLSRAAGVGDDVRVGVAWSAGELKAFRAVLAGCGTGYELVPLGDDIESALGARTAGRPDLVAMPQPGTVMANLSNLVAVPDDLWRSDYDRLWLQDLRPPSGRHYALPFKLGHASVVWYRKRLFAEHGLRAPRTWAEWMALNQRIIDDPDLGGAGVAPLALGGADGWLLAVFFENLLLRHFTDTYEALSHQSHNPRLWAGDEVEEALRMLAGMWSVPGAVAGELDRALVQQFPDAVLEVFLYRRAAMVVAPDYAESVIREFGVPDDDVDTFTFPARDGDTAPLAVAGDFLVLAKPARPAAFALLDYLAGPDAPVPWIRDTGGFIAANPDTDHRYYSPILSRLATELTDEAVQFRLSDQLGPVGGKDGLQLVLQRLMRSLAAGTPPATAARAATREMVDADEASR